MDVQQHRRSVLAVIVLHFMQNFSGEFVGLDQAMRPIRLVLEVALAVAVVACWGPRAFRRGKPLELADTTALAGRPEGEPRSGGRGHTSGR